MQNCVCDGIHSVFVAFLRVSAVSYSALRKLAFCRLSKIGSYTLPCNVLGLMFKGLAFKEKAQREKRQE